MPLVAPRESRAFVLTGAEGLFVVQEQELQCKLDRQLAVLFSARALIWCYPFWVNCTVTSLAGTASSWRGTRWAAREEGKEKVRPAHLNSVNSKISPSTLFCGGRGYFEVDAQLGSDFSDFFIGIDALSWLKTVPRTV